jgi:6,7-dimethyl-8-ribityllumazine synthase
MTGRGPRTLSLKSLPPVREAQQPTGTSGPQPAPRVRQRVLVIEARFYEDIADELINGAIAELQASQTGYERISVPGALEIPQALAQAVAAGVVPLGAPNARYAGVVALGCVIRGETSHYDIVCQNANHWLMEIAIRNGVPVGNAILTVDNRDQAMARATGGREGKGAEAARACLRLIEVARHLQGQGP